MVEVLTNYSKRARHYLQRFEAIHAATKADVADTTKTKPRATKPARQRYRLSDRLGPDVLQKITARYVAGESLHELAAQYGVARSSLSRHMRREGVGIRQQGLTDEQKREILRLRAQGLGIRTIAKRLGCAYGTTRLFLIEEQNQG